MDKNYFWPASQEAQKKNNSGGWRGGGLAAARRSLLSRCCASFSSFNFFFHCFLFKLSNAQDLQRLVASVNANGGATRVE